jgi:phage tail sheath protein FI
VPEYLAPGVYVEETSFRSKSIAGVGTSTAGFVGLTGRGPATSDDGAVKGITPPLLTSFEDFERIYGGIDDLHINGNAQVNYLAHGVRAFFDNGGARLYVGRVLATGAAAASSGMINDVVPASPPIPPPADQQVSLSGRFKGGAIIPNTKDVNLNVTLTEAEQASTKRNALRQPAGTLVREGANFHVLGTSPFETSATQAEWDALPDTTPVTVLTLLVSITDPSGSTLTFTGLGFHARHPNYAGLVLGPTPPRPADRLTNPLMLNVGAAVTALGLRTALFRSQTARTIDLKGGVDGTGAPSIDDFREALARLLALEDIAIVAAPGAAGLGGLDANLPAEVNDALVTHAETRRAYRIALLDPPPDQEPADVRAIKSRIDSTHAALYYPWVVIGNPLAATDKTQASLVAQPPSGFVCGIYARTDIERGVWKAPANETISGAFSLQRDVRFGEQEVLNPLGINCLRFLPNRGFRVWGARTTSSDPEWIYVNIRRYFLYLEASIDQGTQWAVFEPNGDRLWANVRETISDFLYNEWVNGALLGATPAEAFFVRCDRTTMTQNDLDNGRLVCLIGVAALKPAEFVIFRIGQTTASART